MQTILFEKNIMVPMCDGVQLASDIYRLGGVASKPVLVACASYNKDGLVGGGDTFNTLRAMRAD